MYLCEELHSYALIKNISGGKNNDVLLSSHPDHTGPDCVAGCSCQKYPDWLLHCAKPSPLLVFSLSVQKLALSPFPPCSWFEVNANRVELEYNKSVYEPWLHCLSSM